VELSTSLFNPYILPQILPEKSELNKQKPPLKKRGSNKIDAFGYLRSIFIR